MSQTEQTAYYPTSLSYLLARLAHLDLLIRAQVWRARQLRVTDDDLSGFYISEQEIDALLAQPRGLPRWATAPALLSLADLRAAWEEHAAEIARRRAESRRCGIPLRLDTLAQIAELTPLETDILLLALAPELDLSYERLYAYLQDDITKKQPTVDLALNLLCPSFEAKLAARQVFGPTAPLLKHQLLQLVADPAQPSPPLLGKYLKIDERIAGYLLDSDELDARLWPYAVKVTPQTRLEELLLPAEVKRRLNLLVRAKKSTADGLMLYFQGADGLGKQTTAEALCREKGVELLVIDGERLLHGEGPRFDVAVRLAGREAGLQTAALYWTGFEALLADDMRPALATFWQILTEQPRLTFLAGTTPWEPAQPESEQPFVQVEFSEPTYPERLRLWSLALDGWTAPEAAVDLGSLANKFRFSGGQIRAAAATARHLARWRDPKNGRLTTADLEQACRLQSNRRLAALAQKITPHYTWPDIVLPPDRLEQLREICHHVKYRARVYAEWGFDRKVALGKGLNVLFAGPSGTGKTMAAEIMAGELGLELYKIDLSLVVSKYIGETEKNLARIFAEAATSNAILFFDEADALFGKRSEVRDAHDRYANIEISYLLQKMEEYEGVVILATNLRKNMDEAFVRRMHFAVEFPFPGEPERRRIWQNIWPPETPRRPGLDWALLARRFELAGGNIRNVALAAAFLAAADGQEIGLAQLMQATRREYQKLGKVIAAGEFEEVELCQTAD